MVSRLDCTLTRVTREVEWHIAWQTRLSRVLFGDAGARVLPAANIAGGD